MTEPTEAEIREDVRRLAQAGADIAIERGFYEDKAAQYMVGLVAGLFQAVLSGGQGLPSRDTYTPAHKMADVLNLVPKIGN
ncbi:hypothetical protein GCM10009836_52170 [Pseudonocardia ailaonensis]|uniref:Uncharacterized protein n=1 Tax=Pseudonocardia ailaonensis TaxID=367279 RepID=A0ABN2NI38_9PSEU